MPGPPQSIGDNCFLIGYCRPSMHKHEIKRFKYKLNFTDKILNVLLNNYVVFHAFRY